ncbi:MAG: protein kinase domain-containing protein [Anaerovoracaceae bacterium]|jgi:beta-lactam-binding protein with PASTA domain/predicted Ser/Thr protein kinase
MSSKVIAGRYELLQKIGDGGMAVVYKSRDRLLNRYVAVKILKPEYSGDSKFIENFRKESHAAASLSNPNIVNVYDVGKEGNINYIVMELVEGKPLSQIIEEEAPMDYRRVIEISKQVATGLSAAHNHGIIHRDVKPHNILIGEDGIAKIADFGIAKAVSTTTIIDGTSSQVTGSVHYFSPEQAKGAPADCRSDIYSLGIVMYEMLTGQVPFDADNPVSVALMQINNEIVPPSQLVDGIPPSLERIVLRATQKDPADRFESADEMIDALNDIEFVTRFVNSGAAMAAAEEEKEETPKKKDGNRKKKIAAVAVIAAVIALLAGLYFAGIIGGKIIAAPELTGKTVEEAQNVCDKYNIDVNVVDYEYNESFNADEICSQDPASGDKVREGSSIDVVVSKGAEGTVPNLVGMKEDEAKKLITKYGFKVGTRTVKTSGEAAGTVIEQDPGAGEETKPGSEINYTISDGKGKQELEVPNVVGMTLKAAKSAITDAGFEVGTVSYATSTTYSKGTVMAQQYDAGTKLEEKSTIDITVSTGSEGSISLYIDYTQAENDTFLLTVTVSDDNGTRNVVNGERKQKSDNGETLKITGSGSGTITVIFDGTTVDKYSVDFDSGTIY